MYSLIAVRAVLSSMIFLVLEIFALPRIQQPTRPYTTDNSNSLSIHLSLFPSSNLISNTRLLRNAFISSIPFQIRCAELTGPRLCALLDFFIQHFIKMAERCNQYCTDWQKIVYLDHADRLSILLFEHQRFKEDARAYRDKIKVLRRKNANLALQEDRPETPKRNAESAIYVSPLKTRFVCEPSEEEPTVTSSETRNGQSDRSNDHVEGITAAIVHEIKYEGPHKKTLKIAKSDTTSILKTNKGESLETKAFDKSQKVVQILESSESMRTESTYI